MGEKGNSTASHVLVVDDESFVTEATCRLLRQVGYQTSTAARAAEAIDYVREHAGQVDCVLLDVNMPGMSATEALDALKDVDAELPVIICSGRDADSINRQLAPRTPAGVLTKPYTTRELCAQIDRVSRRPSAK